MNKEINIKIMAVGGSSSQAIIKRIYMAITVKYRGIAMGKYKILTMMPIKYPTTDLCLFQGVKKFLSSTNIDN
jgi:hypothetical protein